MHEASCIDQSGSPGDSQGGVLAVLARGHEDNGEGETNHRVRADDSNERSTEGRARSTNCGVERVAMAKCNRRVAAMEKPEPSATTTATPSDRIACSTAHSMPPPLTPDAPHAVGVKAPRNPRDVR